MCIAESVHVRDGPVPRKESALLRTGAVHDNKIKIKQSAASATTQALAPRSPSGQQPIPLGCSAMFIERIIDEYREVLLNFFYD